MSKRRIAPTRKNDRVIIRFLHRGFKFYLGGFGAWADKTVYNRVDLLCQRIELDIKTGAFKCKNNQELAEKYAPDLLTAAPGTSLIELLEERLLRKFSSPDQSLLSHLKSSGQDIRDSRQAQAFINHLVKKGLSPSTVQRYTNTLKAISPLFKDVALPTVPDSEPQPLTRAELEKVLDWFDRRFPFYADYVRVFAMTGMRPSEIIGLRWCDIHWEAGHITLKTALVSSKRNGQRERKPLKGGKPRTIPLNDELKSLLMNRRPRTFKPTDLVFKARRGGKLDDRHLNTRIWHKCVSELQIPNRPFYCLRSTFISHGLALTKDPVEIAAITHGTRSGIRTIYEHYAGTIRPVELPKIL